MDPPNEYNQSIEPSHGDTLPDRPPLVPEIPEISEDDDLLTMPPIQPPPLDLGYINDIYE